MSDYPKTDMGECCSFWVRCPVILLYLVVDRFLVVGRLVTSKSPLGPSHDIPADSRPLFLRHHGRDASLARDGAPEVRQYRCSFFMTPAHKLNAKKLPLKKILTQENFLKFGIMSLCNIINKKMALLFPSNKQVLTLEWAWSAFHLYSKPIPVSTPV